jgi:hypothetical protein
MDEKLAQDLLQELRDAKSRDEEYKRGEHERLNKQEENIAKINLLLIGNGEIGLCERVRKAQAAIENVKSSIRPLWLLVTLFGSTLLAGIIKIVFFSGFPAGG